MKSRAQIRRDPVGFLRTIGFEPWSKQAAVIESVRDHRRTAVRAGHGVGKTAIGGRVALWWLAAFPESIVITTATTWTQVREQLWREIAVAYRSAGALFARAALTDTRLELDERWFALGLSTDTPERFAGYHSERLLVILDEASGVTEPVWEAAESLITTPGSHLLAIGNPLRPSGAFYRAFTTERELYNRIAISALDSPAVTGEQVSARTFAHLVGPDWIEGRRRAWGEDSPLWQARVLGEFPSTADDTVCSLAEVEAAQARRLPMGDPVVVACDVARFGSDETVIVTRRGARVRVVSSYTGRDLMQTVGRVLQVARRLAVEANMPRKFMRIVVDDAGVGGGVTDRLREVGEFPVVAFTGAGSARRPDDYPNRRSEAWFRLSEQLPTLDLGADERLAADLVAPRYSLDSRGRRVVEAKDSMKRRLGRSPDRGDAVVLATSVPAVSEVSEWAQSVVSHALPISGDILTRPL